MHNNNGHIWARNYFIAALLLMSVTLIVLMGIPPSKADLYQFYATAQGGGTPGGSSTQFQYNAGGSFGGIPSAIMSYSSTTGWLTPITTDTYSSTTTFNLATAPNHLVVLAGNPTLALSNATVGQKFTLILEQDATGSRTVTWFSGIRWPSGIVPTLTTTPSQIDVFSFYCIGSNSYLGFVNGQNM